MPIRVFTGSGGMPQLKASFKKNWRHYLQEALGLAIFMISACFFGAMLEGKNTVLHATIQNDFTRMIIMGLMMGSTALFIFYSPWTSPSGSHINPAVTICFWRIGKMCHWDAMFFIAFQLAGGTLAVYLMQWMLGSTLVDPPVKTVVTVPGSGGIWPAFAIEFIIAFITMSMVLFTSGSNKLNKYTRIIAGSLVCIYVITAGPVSGFGMNPARSFASALPAHVWTSLWIYVTVPVMGMLCATEIYLVVKNKPASHNKDSTLQA